MANPKDIREIIPALDEIIGKADLMAIKFEEVNKNYEKLAKSIIESSNKITNAQQKVSGATEEERDNIEENAKAAERLRRAQEAYTNAMSENENQIRSIRQTQREYIKQRQLEEKLANTTVGSYDHLSAKYALLKRQLNALSREERENTAQGREMVEQARAVREEMNALQTETGNYTLQVGNYELATEALTEQLSNMPGIFQEAQGTGKGLLQILKTISKNPIVFLITALAGAVSFLGKEFLETRAGSRKLEEGMAGLRARFDVLKKGARDTSTEIGEFFANFGENMSNIGTKTKEKLGNVVSFFKNFRKNITEDFAGTMTTVLATMNPMARMIVENVNKNDSLVKSIKQLNIELIRAKDAYIDANQQAITLIENFQKQADISRQIADDDTKSFAIRTAAADKAIRFNIKAQEERVNLANKAIAIQDMEIEKAELLGHIDSETGKALTKTGIEIKDAWLNASQAAIEAEKELTLTIAEHEQMRAKLKSDLLEKDLDILIDGFDNQKTINERIIADETQTLQKRFSLLAETSKLSDETFNKQIETIQSLTSEQVNANDLIAESDATVLNQKIRALGLSEIWEGRLLEAIRERKIATIDLTEAERELFSKAYSERLEAFDQEQELNKLRLENSNATAEEMAQFDIDQKIAMYEKQLELAEAYGQDISETEIAIIKEKIKALQAEAEELEGKETFWDKMGLSGEGLQKVKDNFKIAINEIKEIFKGFAEERIEQANLIVEQADREVEASENQLNRQIELQQQGYASNVDEARRQLGLAKDTQKKAIDEQKKAQKLKEQIDTAEQISSIIVASANILKGWSSVPIVGPILAIAAIGSMIASFAITKSKIKSQAKEQFGEGDYIELEGGSHASGNDIPFGSRKGKVMTAEGGESMAVFNKKARNKYGKMLPGLISDINKGRLEERYQNAFNISLPEQGINEANFDTQELKQIKSVLEMIYQQGGVNVTYDKQGRRIERRGNTTRIIS